MKELEKVSDACYKDRKAKYLGSGYDSEVFRFEDRVIKVYKGSVSGYLSILPEETLLYYKEVTNKASGLAKLENWSLYLPFSKESLVVRINPIISMRKCVGCGFTEAESLYIAGKWLSSDHRVDKKEIEIAIRNFSYELEDKLGVTGVRIVSTNAKLLEDKTLMITDLCASILGLRPKVFLFP